MRKIETYLLRDYEVTEGKPFFVGNIVPISMNLMSTEAVGENKPMTGLDVMFLFESKMDDEVLYIEALYELQNDYEIEMAKANPMLIDNFPEEFKENEYKQIMSNFSDDNYFLSDFTFTKTGADGEPELSDTAKSLLEGITTLKPDPYYTFQAVAPSKDTKTYVIRKVNLDKGQWLQLSQFLYWVMMSYPLAPNIFTLDTYKKAKFINVSSMFYDGCTLVSFMNQDTVMAHFTLYFENTINLGNSFGFNIPVLEPEEGIILNKYVEADQFMNLYVKDDTVLPDRIFIITSPDKMCCLLTGLQSGQIIVFTLDPDTAERLNWMDWKKYITTS